VLDTDLEDAVAVADVTIERLRDGNSFVDSEGDGVGLCGRPLRPLDSNVVIADGLLELTALTGNERYRRIAEETLEAFAGASDRFGVQIAGYATVTSRLLEGPLVIRVGDAPGSDLHRAALRVADHEKVVVPGDDAVDGDIARVEYGDQRSRPAETPEQLSEQVQAILR
jgi:uncharacterized protein